MEYFLFKHPELISKFTAYREVSHFAVMVKLNFYVDSIVPLALLLRVEKKN